VGGVYYSAAVLFCKARTYLSCMHACSCICMCCAGICVECMLPSALLAAQVLPSRRVTCILSVWVTARVFCADPLSLHAKP
jgi:hypothetical protein